MTTPMRKYIRYELIDLNGKSVSKTVPERHRNDKVFFYSGILGLGSNQEVLTFPDAVGERYPNAELAPDWETEKVLPWASKVNDGPVAPVQVSRVFCGLNTPLQISTPRGVCQRVLTQLETEYGLHMWAASELEFGLAKGEDWSVPVFQGAEAYTTLQTSKVAGFIYAVEEAMDAVDCDVRTLHTEYGAGQLEITLAPAWGIKAGDVASTFRTGVKELAQQRGMLATFHSKPFNFGNGNGGHFNFSLWRYEKGQERSPALHDPSSKDGLSDSARHFLAGVLSHSGALEAFCSPTPACYTRHGHYAPDIANYADDDRTVAIRIKPATATDGSDCYFEMRMPSSASCAYLVMAAMTAAGMDGLKRKLTLPPPGQKEKDGAIKLPTDLEEALCALESDHTIVEAMGEDLVKCFAAVKREEMKKIDERVQKSVGAGESEDDARLEAWRYMYMEYL